MHYCTLCLRLQGDATGIVRCHPINQRRDYANHTLVVVCGSRKYVFSEVVSPVIRYVAAWTPFSLEAFFEYFDFAFEREELEGFLVEMMREGVLTLDSRRLLGRPECDL